MPIYEYRCGACTTRFEQIQRLADPPLDVCPHCGKGPVERLLSSPAIQFKGSGWYITDYARKGSSSESGASETGGKGTKSDKTEKTEKSEKSGDAASSASASTSDSTSTASSSSSKPAAKE